MGIKGGMNHMCALLTAIALNVVCSQADSVFITELCTPSRCTAASLPAADNYRSLGNKVSSAFTGYLDSWASEGAYTFTTDMMVTGSTASQVWPRISEGTTTHQHTPGYPISVADYLGLDGGRYLSYRAWWTSRTNGPDAGQSPRGARYNGAYIWLNEPNNYESDGSTPIWPFAIEINVWNRYDNGIRPGATRFEDYYDNDGRYEVWGHDVVAEGYGFYAYYVILQEKTITDMNINVKELLRHVVDKSDRLKMWHELIEISAAVEGHVGSDAKFGADIFTLGRP